MTPIPPDSCGLYHGTRLTICAETEKGEPNRLSLTLQNKATAVCLILSLRQFCLMRRPVTWSYPRSQQVVPASCGLGALLEVLRNSNAEGCAPAFTRLRPDSALVALAISLTMARPRPAPSTARALSSLLKQAENCFVVASPHTGPSSLTERTWQSSRSS